MVWRSQYMNSLSSTAAVDSGTLRCRTNTSSNDLQTNRLYCILFYRGIAEREQALAERLAEEVSIHNIDSCSTL
jgi:hypothetical protein